MEGALYITTCVFVIIMGLIGNELRGIRKALEERNKQTFKDDK